VLTCAVWFCAVQVFWAFWFDMVLFTMFQASMLQVAPAVFRLTPFFGLAGWLLAGGTKQDSSSTSSSS
jgi:hypothetical protein